MAASAQLIAPAALADEGSEPGTVEIAHWWHRDGQEEIGKRVLPIIVLSGYCVGEPKPRIDHIEVREQAKTDAHPFRSAVVRAYVEHPPAPQSSAQRRPYEAVEVCAGLGWSKETNVRFKRPVKKLFIYDGFYRPPRLQVRPHPPAR